MRTFHLRSILLAGLCLVAPCLSDVWLVPAFAEGRAERVAQVFGDDPAASYTARLGKIREIAARFPGRIAPAGHEYREMGLMAGIYMQTLWQHQSGRDELTIWYHVNATLTLAPRAYMD